MPLPAATRPPSIPGPSTVTDESAVGTWRFLDAGTLQVQALWIAGRLRAGFVQVEGKWKIKHLQIEDFFATPYEDGWAKRPFPMPAKDAHAARPLGAIDLRPTAARHRRGGRALVVKRVAVPNVLPLLRARSPERGDTVGMVVEIAPVLSVARARPADGPHVIGSMSSASVRVSWLIHSYTRTLPASRARAPSGRSHVRWRALVLQRRPVDPLGELDGAEVDQAAVFDGPVLVAAER